MKSLHVIAGVDGVSFRSLTLKPSLMFVFFFLQVKCDCGQQVEKMNLEEHKVNYFE